MIKPSNGHGIHPHTNAHGHLYYYRPWPNVSNGVIRDPCRWRLYSASSVVDEFSGFDDVTLIWTAFARGSPVAPYEECIAGYRGIRPRLRHFAESAVDELFTLEEAEELSEFLRWAFGVEAEIHEVSLPLPPSTVGLQGVGGYGDLWYPLYKVPGYDLSVNIEGYITEHDLEGKFPARPKPAKPEGYASVSGDCIIPITSFHGDDEEDGRHRAPLTLCGVSGHGFMGAAMEVANTVEGQL